MKAKLFSGAMTCFFCALSLLLAACSRGKQEAKADRPRLTPNVTMRDITFHSAALNRDIQYRVVLPASPVAGAKMPVVYLLHGGGGGFRDWSNYSDVARFAEQGTVEMVGVAGYYTYQSMVLNTARTPVTAPPAVLLKPLP